MAVGLDISPDATRPAATHKLEFSQRHAQKNIDPREEQAASLQQHEIDRVSRWIEECERARAVTEQGKDKEDDAFDCDGDTEDLLLAVLVARPEYHTVPAASQVRQFARELRSYRSKLSTLERTRGYFRVTTGRAAGFSSTRELPAYPEDIDDLPDVEVGGDEKEREERLQEVIIARGVVSGQRTREAAQKQNSQRRRREKSRAVSGRALDMANGPAVVRAAVCPNFARIEAF